MNKTDKLVPNEQNLAETTRWNVRGIRPDLARHIRALAVLRNRPIADLVNEALERYVVEEEQGE